MDSREQERRSSGTDAVMALFRAHPRRWITWQDLAKAGGSCAWRTRVSDARKRFHKTGLDIVWNGQVKASAYMLREQPLGRDASQPLSQAALF